MWFYMRRWLLAAMIGVVAVSGCSKSKSVPEQPQTEHETAKGEADETVTATDEADTVAAQAVPEKERVKVKGIYISGFMAGSEGLQTILDNIDKTEINAVVIDVKNDEGRITYAMDSKTVNEIGASEKYIRDIQGLMADLKARGIYTIARVVAFRDPYLAEQKPEWSLKNADGSLHRDKQGLAWVNPYKQEVWDYLVEVGIEAAEVGFDEIQFDYIRFSTDATMKDVVFDEADTKGRSKTSVITEFITYAYDQLSAHHVFVSADVFGTIIGSKIDADAVGQVYHEMADHLDYICPMIYPSHYGDGNFGIEHPDTQPYDTIHAALMQSKRDLGGNRTQGVTQAIVRPWLQDFTATYLKNYIPYGADEIRAQIQAVYDAGYDEWILWSASNKYTWDGLLTPDAAKEEQKKIEESRAALPPETTVAPKTTAALETEAALPSSSADLTAEQSASEQSQKSAPGRASTESMETDAVESGAADPLNESSQPAEESGPNKPNVVIITTGANGEFR